jgi:ankyrin repeat protein
MALGSKQVCEGRLVSDNEKVVRLLLVMGADVEERGGAKKTPLLYAAWRSRVTVVKILVEAGADMKARDNTGWTVIHWAASRNGGDAEVLK